MKTLIALIMVSLSTSTLAQVDTTWYQALITESDIDSLAIYFDSMGIAKVEGKFPCYIVCEKLDTVGFRCDTLSVQTSCPDNYPGCCVLHYKTIIEWNPITVKRELCRILIPCEQANLIEPRYLKVIR